MIKTAIYITSIVLMVISCSQKKETTVTKKETTEKKVYKKTLFIALNYEIKNLTLDEDVKLLPSSNLSLYSTFFEESLLSSLHQNGFEIVKRQAESNYQIIIKDFSLKEFILQVDGPSVNVATSSIKYSLVMPSKEITLFSEVNKESIEPFEESIFQDVVNELAVKMIDKVARLAK